MEADSVVTSVRKGLGSIKCAVFDVDAEDLDSAALSLAEKIMEEMHSGCTVLVNLSGSCGLLGVAAYLAALSTGTPAYLGVPGYADGRVCIVKKVVSVPFMPLKDLLAEKRDILRALGAKPGGLLLEELIKRSGKLREASSERSRMSYHISDLKRDGLVETSKEGRNIRVKASSSGLLYASSLGRADGYGAKK
jgi:DNA-binding transcriptional ArsR family regulator